MNKDSFLYRVAQSITNNKDIDFENTLVILPNQRAKNFLSQYICNSDSPIFLFDMVSIDDVVKNNVYDKILMDKLPLIYNLYKSYCKVYYSHNQPLEGEKIESFTDFYTWGRKLLNDFDEIDKHLIEAKIFYRNIKEYKDLQADTNEYLTKEQKEILQRFFNIKFDSDEQPIIKNFVKIWNCLYDIYEDFNNSLLEQNSAYSGRMYKDFALRLENREITLKYKHIIIVGFSVLNQVEKKIFQILKNDYQTEFYWDYDIYYADNMENEAGIFIRENIKQFPMPANFQKLSFDRINNSKQKLKIVKSSYSSYSLAYIKQWLNEINYRNQDPNDIAIILHDESIIPMVLKSLPEDISVNITMGYPFIQTLLYNKIMTCVNECIKQGFQSEDIDRGIRLLAQDILKQEDENIFWQLDVLKSINETLLAFAKTLDYYKREDISEEILLDVVKKYLNKESADLISDATNGIQIMGLLETRCLDFKYVLMLSTSDDNLPKIASDSSFIPFSFKEAYNMMSVKRKTGLFAYYFYRLFHTAERMDFVYNSKQNEKELEMSRFLRQIKIELPNKPEETDFVGNKLYTTAKKECRFDISELKFLDKGEKTLSASSLNKLIDCEKKFYYSSIKGLSKDIEIENYRAIAFGNMFHLIANMYYQARFTDKNKEDEALIIEVIESAFNNPFDKETQKKDYFNRQKDLDALEGFHKQILSNYLQLLVKTDKEEGNQYILGEENFTHSLSIGEHIIHFKSRLDRIDTDKNDNFRIVDYKTGKRPKDFKINSIADIFDRERDRMEIGNIFEILFYCWLIYNQKEGNSFKYTSKTNIKPTVLFISDIKNGDIIYDNTPLIYTEQINEEFEKELKALLSTLITKGADAIYEETTFTKTCKKCDFALLCGK